MTEYKRYSGYKDSGIDWLGEIPAQWDIKSFQNCFNELSELNGENPVGKMVSVSGYRGVEYKTYSSDEMRRTVKEVENYRVIRPGQLAVNTMWLNYGGLGVSEIEGHMSPAYRAYSIKEIFHNRFVHHLLRSSIYIQGYTGLLRGLRPNSLQMSRRDLMVFPILIPSLKEQEYIAKFLDRETADIDAGIANMESLIALLTEKRSALISEAVTRGIPGEHTEFKDSGVEWIGDIPAEWDKVSFGQLFKRIKNMGTGNEELLSVYREYGVIPKSSRSDNHNVASEDLSKYQIVSKNNLVINKMKAWQGSLAISEYDGIVSPAYFVFEEKVKRKNSLKFLHYLMRSNTYKGFYASVSKGIRLGQWDLDQKAHKSMPVLIPFLDEQNRIVSFIDSELPKIDALAAEAKSAIGLLKEKRQTLISDVVTGKIDVRNSSN